MATQVPRRLGSVLSRLLGREDDVVVGGGGEEREAELHLYAVSQTSRLYLHLLSSWNSFIIVSQRHSFTTKDIIYILYIYRYTVCMYVCIFIHIDFVESKT